MARAALEPRPGEEVVRGGGGGEQRLALDALVALLPLRFRQDLAQERFLDAPAAEALAREHRAHDGPTAVEHVVAVGDAARSVLEHEPAQGTTLEAAGDGGGDVGVVPDPLAAPV